MYLISYLFPDCLRHFLQRNLVNKCMTRLFLLKSNIFWNITPCSPLSRCFGGNIASFYRMKNKTSKKPAWKQVASTARSLEQSSRLSPAFTLVSCLAYSLTLNNETLSSSEKSVDFQRTTWRYIPKDITLLCVTTAVRTSNPTYFWNAVLEGRRLWFTVRCSNVSESSVQWQ
jgi:hypothetical protein